MFSILDLQHQSDRPEASAPALSSQIEDSLAAAEEPAAQLEEFEFVLGRRQIASLMFVATVILMVCVAGAYLVGKSVSPKAAPLAGATAVASEPEPPPIVLNQEPAPIAEPPMFAEPKNGSIYIQMGAVEKGVSVVLAEGLRKRGLPAFVAPGPSEKIFRVLIGPLPDPASYVKAKDAVDKLGLATFARRFPN